jgi:pimeloyl-ACP methyl ester carboxylesterase
VGELTRRGLLLGGAAAALGTAAWGAAACSTGNTAVPGPPAGPPPVKPAALAEPVTVERVYSVTRAQTIEMVLMVPEGVPASGLPVCLALHGRGGRARDFIDLGVPRLLTDTVRRGGPPFAVAAVDGDHYWVAVDQRDDPQRMLSTELPIWLEQRDLRPVPSAAFGISMGGFGALRYARDHHDLRAVAGMSPALFQNWPDARARKVFHTPQQWETNEPLRHIEDLRGIPLGVWCGVGDTFVAAARKFCEVTAPAVASFTPGVHNDKFWKRVTPEVMNFVAKRMR